MLKKQVDCLREYDLTDVLCLINTYSSNNNLFIVGDYYLIRQLSEFNKSHLNKNTKIKIHKDFKNTLLIIGYDIDEYKNIKVIASAIYEVYGR